MKKHDLKELLTASEGKKLLFLGREGIYTTQEIERFLKRYKIGRVKQIEEGVVASVEHHSLNPVEEMLSEEIYARRIPSYSLELFEQLLSENINDDELLMAIKLSNDQIRLLRMIENPHISDTLFVKLLEMYRWSDEDEDNNEDRSVVIATLTRYIDITPAQRDQLYSTLTLKRLVRETTDPKLLYALIGFPNYEFKQKDQGKTSLYEVIATSPLIDEAVIKRLLGLRNPKVDMYLAANAAVSLELLKKLSQREDNAINEALAANESIDDALFEMLLKREADTVKLLLWFQPITQVRYEAIVKNINDETLFAQVGKNLKIEEPILEKLVESDNIALLKFLGLNHTVSVQMIERLYSRDIKAIKQELASHPSLDVVHIKEWYETSNDDIAMMQAIASNPVTPESILRALFERDELEINKGLAANPSTPIELLDILKIDTRLRHALTLNEVFIEHHNSTKVVV